MNVNNTPLASMGGITVNDNRFGHDTRVADCPIVVTQVTQLAAASNVFDDTGFAVRIRYG